MELECGQIENEEAEIQGIPQLHPLFQYPVLDNVFSFIKDDLNTLTNCRLVHSSWVNRIFDTSLPLPIRVFNIDRSGARNVDALMEIVSSPDSWLTVQDLHMSEVNFDSTPIISLVMECGREMKNLKIDKELNLLSLLILMEECPNLKELEVNLSNVHYLEVAERFKKTWENPLPRLKRLTIAKNRHQHHFGQIATSRDLIEVVMHLMRNIRPLEIFAVKQVEIQLWEKIAEKLREQEPEMYERLKAVHLDFHSRRWHFFQNILPPDAYHHIWEPKLPIKVLNMKYFMLDITTEQLGLIFENLADTLEVFTIKMDMVMMHMHNNQPNLEVKFPREMVALQRIEIDHRRPTVLTAAGESELLEVLPRLNFLKHSCANKVPNPDDENQWNRLLSIPSNNGFTHVSLTELKVDWLISNNDIIHRLKEKLPELRRLGVTVRGQLMEGLVVNLADSKVQELKVKFMETAEGMDEFASSISGLSVADCESFGTRPEAEIVKVRPSLAEWTGLRKLTVDYVGSNVFKEERGYAPMNNVTVWGLGKIVQLNHLVLKNIEIHPQQVSKILGKLSLTTFDLSRCKINDWNRKYAGRVKAKIVNVMAVRQIRAQYPGVRLISVFN